MAQPKTLTTVQAAQQLAISQPLVRLACAQGRLSATKFGRDWMILIDAKFRRFHRLPRGRPPKPR